MELKERMEMVAAKLVDGVQWGDLPWDGKFTKTLYRRLMGHIEQMPEWTLAHVANPRESFVAASANEEIVGAAALLHQSVDFGKSPEGPAFWHSVTKVLEEIEQAFYDNQPERN